jgi:hypothetical protein
MNYLFDFMASVRLHDPANPTPQGPAKPAEPTSDDRNPAVPPGQTPGETGGTPDPFATRWGPSLDHAEPSIDLPADSWRWRVANWPHERWAEWRRRAGELEPPNPNAEMIRVAEHLAYVELTRAPVTACGTSDPVPSPPTPETRP